MEVIDTVSGMRDYVGAVRDRKETICLVPTMGYLHKGHLDLMRLGRTLADRLVTSVFVNPTQFGPSEDLERYPRDFEGDRRRCAEVGVDCIFSPGADEMYPEGYSTYVEVEGVTRTLCGTSRPGHFRGVATVVAKLFNICSPDVAVFGEKDYQQLVVIRRMVKDLNMDVRIVSHPIVREEDGLAMSSRNAYLDPGQRRAALVLNRALGMARGLVQKGERDAERIRLAVLGLIGSTPEAAVDYVEIVDPETLQPVDTILERSILALAVKIGKTRLIDNTELVIQ
jgi:pantoate--beta-alanine ligase